LLSVLTYLSSHSLSWADVEVVGDGVGESVEFSLVNNSWGSGVNSLSSGLNPSPVGSGWCIVVVFSELFKTNFDLFVGEGTIVVGIDVLESFISLGLGKAVCLSESGSSWSSWGSWCW
jgi:hypothetical protein